MCCSFVCLYNNIVEMLIYIYVHQIKKTNLLNYSIVKCKVFIVWLLYCKNTSSLAVEVKYSFDTAAWSHCNLQ